MDGRFGQVAVVAAGQHSVVSLRQLEALGVGSALRSKWVQRSLLERLGPQSYAIAGSEPTWRRTLAGACFDAGGVGAIGGRAAAQLMGLDGFQGDAVELIVPRAFRGRLPSAVLHSTSRPLPSSDLQRVGCLTVVRAERLIVDAPWFGFSRAEVENAIDSAIRLRLVSEQRLRTRVVREHNPAVNGSRRLLDAMVDTGGESRLERWFLALCRRAGLPRPLLRVTYRLGSRTVARVDAEFPGGLVVELNGHGTHSSRRAAQRDAQRRTELTAIGRRVVTFTYEDVRDRPAWVAAQLRALLLAAAA